jgi:hypothetical protein
MRRQAFEAMVQDMVRELPREYQDGIVAIEVTGKTVPHPVRSGIYTLGECIPHSFGAPGEADAELHSTVQLHYGSFSALAATEPGFEWRHEAWETLLHEVRHHLEWRAQAAALEAFDEAVEANYARVDGEPFEPLFHLHGERVAPGITKVEDDVFIDRPLRRRAWRRAAGATVPVDWHGRSYRVTLPARLPDVLFLTLLGVEPPPAGDLVLVVRRAPGLRDVFRRPEVGRHESRVEA